MSKERMERIVPMRMYGMRFPIFVLVLSDRRPKYGKRNRANTLSKAITTPIMVSFMANVFFRILGISLL